MSTKLDLFDLFGLQMTEAIDDPALEWTDVEIRDLRQFLIEDTLSKLRHPRTSREAHAEILFWIASDAVHPFSFLVCAEACGFDPEALREALGGYVDLKVCA